MSSYVDDALIADERVIHLGNISLWSLFIPIGLGVVTLPLYGIGLIFLLVAYVRYKTTELAITNKRVIAKFGLIQRSTVEIGMDKIESVQVHQSIIGRIFDYGTLVVAGAGTPQAPIPGISNPIGFRKAIAQAQESKK